MATQAERDEILRNADIPGIGSHCDVETCKQLDFLPFDCESCKGYVSRSVAVSVSASSPHHPSHTQRPACPVLCCPCPACLVTLAIERPNQSSTFCLDHRTETAHSCKKAGTWLSSFRPAAAAVTRAPQTLGGAPSACAASRCKTQINTPTHPGVRCPTCRKQFCLAHRLQDSHECRPPPPAAATVAQEKARDALQRFKASWAPKATSSRSSSTGPGMFAGLRKSSGSSSSVAAVAKMKREAKGDEKVASEKRIYLFVEAEARTTTAKIPRGTFWYSKVLCPSTAG